MEGKLNQYSDHLIETTGFHGSDISSQRIDELDQLALEYVLKHREKHLKGLDIGCGSGIQGVRFALLNAEMGLIDILDIGERIRRLASDLFLVDKLTYLQKDIRKISAAELPHSYDFIYSQRFIHYLKFTEATGFVSLLSEAMEEGGKLFLSASGITSELGTGYAGQSSPLQDRFFQLSPKMASKHGIFEKVCLYREEELRELLSGQGFKIQSAWTSLFGNIKIVAQKQ